MVKIKNIGHNSIVKMISFTAASFAGGYLLSGTSTGGISSFADISLTGLLGLPFAAAAFIGAAVRCVTAGTVGRCIVKLAAMSMILSAKLFSERSSRPKQSGIITALSVVISGAAVSALIGELPQKLLFYALYGLICGFTAYSGARLTETLRTKRSVDLSGASGISCAVVYIITAAALSSMELPLDAGLIAGTVLTLGAACFYGSTGAMICGALTVTGAYLASPEMVAAAAVLPASGMAAGAVRKGNIAAAAMAFAAAGAALILLTASDSVLPTLFSLLCGIGAFMVIAPHVPDKWIVAGSKTAALSDLSGIRLSFLSDVIEAVRVDSARITAALTAAAPDVTLHPVTGVCAHCYRRSLCGGADMEASGELIPTVPESCIRKRELAEELEKALRNRAAENVMKLRMSEERSLLSEQLKMTGELVRSLSAMRPVRGSAAIADRVRSRLEDRGIAVLRVTAFYNDADRLMIGVYLDSEALPENTARIRDLAADELGTELCIGTTVSSARETRVSLYERPRYELEISTAAMSADGTAISGDSSATFTDETGVSYVVLSDGMGSGRDAAVDSHIVIGMFRRLICSGMETGTAVKLINSVMATKSRNESFATLDVISFDPDTCRMTSVKSGAAATILRRGDDVLKIFAPTFPVGIVRQAELSVAEHDLSAGDMIVMFSDGISDSAGMFIKEQLTGGGDIRSIVREIASRSSVFSQTDRPDDVTVIGIKVRQWGDF